MLELSRRLSAEMQTKAAVLEQLIADARRATAELEAARERPAPPELKKSA
jgi:hypothetical protein